MTTLLEEKTNSSIAIKPPSMYKVVFRNDDVTPMEFVVSVLVNLFRHTVEDASKITQEVHENGKGVAGVYTYEVADQKVAETISLSRANGFPFFATLEIA